LSSVEEKKPEQEYILFRQSVEKIWKRKMNYYY